MAVSEAAQQLLDRANEAIKNHRSAATWNLGFGVVLLSLALSVTDAALLVRSAQEIKELGAAVPVTLILGFGPVGFLFSCAYVNRSEFEARRRIAIARAGLGSEPEATRALSESLESSPLLQLGPPHPGFGGVVSVALGGFLRLAFPVMVVVALEVSGLRAQEPWLTITQQICVVALVALICFASPKQADHTTTGLQRIVHLGALAATSVLLLTWGSIASSDDQVLREILPYDAEKEPPTDLIQLCKKVTLERCFSAGITDPLDTVICDGTDWGCRYMRVYGQTLAASQNKDPMPVGAHDKGEDKDTENGADLHERSLRFADLSGAVLLSTDFTNADLRGAALKSATLTDAILNSGKLAGAHLQCSNLGDAKLRGADLSGANLKGADLKGADLTDADLTGANLTGVRLVDTIRKGARFRRGSISATRSPVSITSRKQRTIVRTAYRAWRSNRTPATRPGNTTDSALSRRRRSCGTRCFRAGARRAAWSDPRSRCGAQSAPRRGLNPST
jgi:hypothetical protein